MSDTHAAHAAQAAGAIRYSVFRSVTDTRNIDERSATWPEMIEMIKSPKRHRTKRDCWLLKLAVFGDKPNENWSLRHDDNVVEVCGIEGDYDAELVTPAQAADMLRAARIEAIIYTTPSHTPDKPRWRVLAPLSGAVAPTLRAELVSLLNGALGCILAGESWALSQTYYFGAVKGVQYEAHHVEGERLDVIAICPDFDSIEAPTKVKAAHKSAAPRRAQDADGEEVRHLADTGWLTGGHRDDGAVNVRCPWAEMHISDSGPSSTTCFPAGVGGRSEGGFECRHQSCGKPTTTEFWRASGLWALQPARIVNEFPMAEVTPGEPELLPAFVRDKAGKILAERNNLFTVLMRSDLCGLRIGYDTFKGAVMVAQPGTDQWRQMKDTDYTAMCKHVEAGDNGFKPISAELARELVRYVAETNRFDSAQTWLNSLQWDGVERVATFLIDRLNAADTPYVRAVSGYLWTGLAGRVLDPGIKADMVPVLVGGQGKGKSSVTAAIAPDAQFFGVLDPGRKDADQTREMPGKLVIELGELRGLRVKEREALKGFITRRIDEVRPLYSEFMGQHPRRCLFIGTTNSKELLDDDTGHRRWLPVEVLGHADLDARIAAVAAVARDRDQLWAEAAVMFEKGGIAWRDAETLAPAEHSKFEVVEPWTQAIERWLEEPDGFDETQTPRGDAPFTIEDVLRAAVNVDLKQITSAHRQRVAKVLRSLGYSEERRMLQGRRSVWWSKCPA